MNHLAHVFLAPDSPEARIGSILGDFTRGVDVSALPGKVRNGVRHHLAVDGFTDRHPDVLASKALFSGQRRRFSGVALDVLYDHYLLRHWQDFSHQDRDTFVRRIYRELQTHEYLMPPRMTVVMRKMVHNDWFGAYEDLNTVGYALDRIAERIRFPNQFRGIIEEIRANDVELEVRFLTFFPDLKYFAREI